MAHQVDNNLNLPLPPYGSRWFIRRGTIKGNFYLQLQFRKSFLGIKYWAIWHEEFVSNTTIKRQGYKEAMQAEAKSIVSRYELTAKTGGIKTGVVT